MRKAVAVLAIVALALAAPYALLTYFLYRIDTELGNPRPRSTPEMERLVGNPSWSLDVMAGDRWQDHRIPGWGLIAFGYPPNSAGSVIWAYGMPRAAVYFACIVQPLDDYRRPIALLAWDSCELRDMTA